MIALHLLPRLRYNLLSEAEECSTWRIMVGEPCLVKLKSLNIPRPCRHG